MRSSTFRLASWFAGILVAALALIGTVEPTAARRAANKAQPGDLTIRASNVLSAAQPPVACINYTIASSSGAVIVPGTTDIGNHCDDCTTNIGLPFTYTIYGQNFNSANVSSNGLLGFSVASSAFVNQCLPDSASGVSIFPHWDDFMTDNPHAGCSSYPGGNCGVFTSTSGIAPNRIFNIEWRAVLFLDLNNPVNLEARLYEGQNRFDLVYGPVQGNGSSATVGVQDFANGCFTQFECNTGGLSNGLQLAFTFCSTPPTITCPGGITKFTDSGQLTATVNPGTPVANSNCGIQSVTGVRSDGQALNAPYPIGVTNITWTATDLGGNTATCGQSIAVMVPGSPGGRRIPE